MNENISYLFFSALPCSPPDSDIVSVGLVDALVLADCAEVAMNMVQIVVGMPYKETPTHYRRVALEVIRRLIDESRLEVLDRVTPVNGDACEAE